MTDTPDLDGLLADRALWTLADICREIGMSPLFAAEYALRSLHELPGTARAYPAPVAAPHLPGGSMRQLLILRDQGNGKLSGPSVEWVQWAAGDIRRWALETCRIGPDMKPVKVAMPRRPRTGGAR